MRVVVDTGVLTRAVAGPEGPAGAALSLIRPPHLLILSAAILDELARVLTYERVRRIHSLDDEGIDRYLTGLEAAALIAAPKQTPRVVPGDLDDDGVVAAAVAGGAEIICTRDRHFYHDDVLAYCRQRGIRILSDVELLQCLRHAEGAQGEAVS